MGFPLIFFPIWMIVFLVLSVLLLLVLWVWALISCIASRMSVPEKLFWIFIIIFFNIFGALLYFIFSSFRGEKMARKKSFKGKRFLRSKNKAIAGVCSGIANYFGIDPTIVRLIWVVFIFVSFGAAILAYIIAWIIIPEER